MARIEITKNDYNFLQIAFDEARKGYDEGGVPVGCALAVGGAIIARGRNRLVQEGNPVLHGETDCLRNAGRGINYSNSTLYTSLSPCAMCSGAIILFGIPRVIIGDDVNFPGEVSWLLDRGVDVAIVNDPEIVQFFRSFATKRSHLWREDISGYHLQSRLPNADSAF